MVQMAAVAGEGGSDGGRSANAHDMTRVKVRDGGRIKMDCSSDESRQMRNR